nr:NUDIX hydrolase [Peptoanaerobacter stomatis]
MECYIMREETSAGGVVVFSNAILLLKKYNKDWVLPKGRNEQGEKLEQTAVREVYEESMIKAEILKYLGEIHYTFNDNIDIGDKIHKTVYWYLMTTQNNECYPQKEEGFVEARFIEFDKALDYAKYEDEKSIIKVAIEHMKKINSKKSGKK